MLKKVLLVIMCLVMSIAIFACGGAKTTQSDPQVAELQKQLADLQQQVQNQQNQPVQNNQSNQQVQQNNQVQTNQQVQQNTQIQNNQQVQQNNQSNQNFGQGIDVEQAKQIATQHAGFNTSNVTFTKQKYDFDDGMAKWEIEFVVNTNKYEVEVSASNGTILKYQVESIYND